MFTDNFPESLLKEMGGGVMTLNRLSPIPIDQSFNLISGRNAAGDNYSAVDYHAFPR